MTSSNIIELHTRMVLSMAMVSGMSFRFDCVNIRRLDDATWSERHEAEKREEGEKPREAPAGEGDVVQRHRKGRAPKGLKGLVLFP